MQITEINWNSKDGKKLFTRIWEPESDIKAVLCLAHGIGEHTGRFHPVADYFTSCGYAMMGTDMRGHGLSEGKRGHIPSIGVIMDDMDLLISNAKLRYPGKPVFLYGQSLGAILVLFHGLSRRPDINGVIATSPALHSSLDEQPVKIALVKLLSPLIPSLTLHGGLKPVMLTRNMEVVNAYINDPLVHYQISLGFGKILLDIRKWALENSSGFSIPLLLMHGTGDQIAYISGSREFARHVSNCNYIEWENALHELHHEPEKQEVLNTIRNWMERRILSD